MLDLLAALIFLSQVTHVQLDLLLSLLDAILNLALHLPCLLLLHPVDLHEPLTMVNFVTQELLGAECS